MYLTPPYSPPVKRERRQGLTKLDILELLVPLQDFNDPFLASKMWVDWPRYSNPVLWAFCLHFPRPFRHDDAIQVFSHSFEIQIPDRLALLSSHCLPSPPAYQAHGRAQDGLVHRIIANLFHVAPFVA